MNMNTAEWIAVIEGITALAIAGFNAWLTLRLRVLILDSEKRVFERIEARYYDRPILDEKLAALRLEFRLKRSHPA